MSSNVHALGHSNDLSAGSKVQTQLETLTQVAVFRAVEPQELPPLVTTAVHGALGRVLKQVGADAVFNGPAVSDSARALGVTDAPPPAYVLAPGRRLGFVPGQLQHFEPGQLFDLEVTLLGPRAVEAAPLMAAALAGVAALGLARRLPDGTRPKLELLDVATRGTRPRLPAQRALLEFRTPVRLTFEGKVSGRLDAEVLCASLRRRAEILAQVHGVGASTLGVCDSEPLRVRAASLSRVQVERYSHRQRRRMRWPGLLGWIEVEGAAPWWPLLELCERTQVGKATSFGFGKFDLVPCEKDQMGSEP